MRHSAVACDVYQTTDVAYLVDWGLQIMSIGTRLFSMKDPHRWVQPSPTTVTIPNTKAMIERATGRRLWRRLFVRP
jgi:hypothetical protein